MTKLLSTLAIALCVLLTGCADSLGVESKARPTATSQAHTSQSETELPDPAPSTSDTPTPEPVDDTNERGNTEVALGEEVGMTDSSLDDAVIVRFTIDKIRPITVDDCEMPEYQDPPENGQLIAVDIRAATTKELGQSDAADFLSIDSTDFSYIAPDGVTLTDLSTISTYGCVPSSQEFTSDTLRPASKYRGTMVLDVTKAKGFLVYRPYYADDLSWEWKF